MAFDVNNVKLGACDVDINGTNIGLTKGGVVVSIRTKLVKLNNDKFGSDLPDSIIDDRIIKVKIPFAESTLENLNIALPDAALTVNGAKKRLDINEGIGTLLRASSVEIILRPITLGAADPNDYVTFPVAVTDGTISATYQVKKERVFEVEFDALKDANDLMMFFGDATA